MSDVKIPGVLAHTHKKVTVLRSDVRFAALMDTYEMEDGSTKILIVSPQPYIEITIPKPT